MTAWRSAPEVPGYSDFVEIGSGGFATVYRARREAFDQTVAVKFIHVGSAPEGVRMRFERERRALGSLAHHPHIVTVYDGGVTAGGSPYLVMEYLPAGSLEQSAGRLDLATVLRIGVQLSGALETAHRADVLHRDVKPANVLRSRYGDPVLADFGIARLAGGGRTTSGVVTASLAYAPPEVLEAKHPGPASDVWSMAATLVCLLTGQPPFAAEVSAAGVPALITRILRDEPPDLVGQGVPADVAVPLLAALTNDLGERVASARRFGESLREIERRRGMTMTTLVIDEMPNQRQVATTQGSASPPVVVPPPSGDHAVSTVPFPRPRPAEPASRTSAGRRRRRWQTALAALLVVGLVAVVVVVLTTDPGSPGSPATASPGASPLTTSAATPSTTSAPAAVEPLMDFPPTVVGKWTGRALLTSPNGVTDGNGGPYEFNLTVTIPDLGIDGTIVYDYPDWKIPCPGSVKLRPDSTDNPVGVIEVTDDSPCYSQTRLTTLTREGDTLRYVSDDAYQQHAAGTLTRAR